MNTETCTNRTPLRVTDANGNPLQRSVCRECGGFLAILEGSNKFRTHKRVFKHGDPRIAESITNDTPEQNTSIKRYA